MAEFALGLTKTAVEGTVSRVKSAMDEEAKLKVQVQNDLMFITGEFQMMQSFLNVANRERAKNEVVRTWVRQIRDLAFDTEDCIELVVSLDNKSRCSWLWYMLPDCMAPLRPLDQTVAEIQRLKARVEDVSHRNTRYNLIGDSGSSINSSKTNALATTTFSSPSSELVQPATAGTGSSSSSSSAFHILRGVWEASGKMRPDMGELQKLITNEGSDLEVISLWESPGSASDLGTTPIVRKAYNDPKIRQEFQWRAWVKLMHPFNLEEFLMSLITQFYASSHLQENLEPCFRTTEEYHLIKKELMQQLCQQRYLVVVEQLCTVAEWDAIKMYLPNGKNGSRIVVTGQQLGLLLNCTGEPYQVSELRQLSNGQSLCAFFNKVSGRRSDMGELIWKIRRGGVISLWRSGFTGANLIDKVYRGIAQKSIGCGVFEFHRHCWVDVPYPFDLGIFSRRLFFNLHSKDLRAAKITDAGALMEDTGVIQACCKFLCEDDCFIVIDGVHSTDDWDLIKHNFISNRTKGCIIATTTELSVATHCVDEADRVVNIKHLDADDVVLRHLVKACEYHGIEASEGGHFFYNRTDEAFDWMDKFELVVDPEGRYNGPLRDHLQVPGVSSLCGTTGAWQSALAREIYNEQLIIARCIAPKHGAHGETIVDLKFTKYSWVSVPHPFNLMDLCLRLFLDFHSDNPKAKQTAAFSIMEGRQDTVEGCLRLLRQEKCFVVIEGLQSRHDWDLIKDTLLSEPIKGCILVITNDISIATYCVHKEDRVFFIKDYTDNVTNHYLTKQKGYSDRSTSYIYSSRMVEARNWIKKFELFGHESVRLQVCSKIYQGVTSVWGIAGVGKSALVRSIYYYNMIGCENYFSILNGVKIYSWVDVPQLFNITDLSRNILMDFYSDGLEAKETAAVAMMEGQDPIQHCREFLRQHKCFIVIDGLRSKDDWDMIKVAFLSEPIEGFIIVIASEESIATHCADSNTEQVVNVKGLEEDMALKLFTKIVWASEPLTSEKVMLSRLITDRCGGLPKVITTIGEYCRRSNLRRVAFAMNFMGILETHPISHSLRGLFSWMQSYFDDCRDSLKPCIFYLSVFPLGHNIRRRRLLRRWIAEGYCRDTPGSPAEVNAENFFFELIKLSIIHQRISPGNADICQVNGFFREYIISRPMEDNLVFALEARCILNTQRVGQHLTISSNWDRDKILFESLELSRLRSLTVFGEWKSFLISTNVNTRLLRVLDLEDTSGVTDGDIEQIGKLLPHLKFLSLRGCKHITSLPSTFGGLRQLQTLDIKGTSIVMLPPVITKLEKLQYVRAGSTHCLSTCIEDNNGIGVATPPPAGRGCDDFDFDKNTYFEVDMGIPPRAAPDVGDPKSPHIEPPKVSQSAPPPAVGDVVSDDGMSISKQPAAAGDDARTSKTWGRRLRGGLVSSWLSKLHKTSLVSNIHDGIQFSAAEGIGKLTALHTLGVVNTSGIIGKAVLRELKNLTQLRKLKLAGVNRKNWQDFCCTISGHGYLESLSVRLDNAQPEDVYCLDDISMPPKTIKILKLYGRNVHVSPVWMKQLDRLTKLDLEDLELTISKQEDIDSLHELQFQGQFRQICIKPIQDGKLRYGRLECWWRGEQFKAAKIIKIDCGNYRSEIVFGKWIPRYVEVLVVHCSTTQSYLEVSGLDELLRLKEIWLKGSYSNALKQQLQRKVEEHNNNPVLKLEEQPSSS